MIPPDKTLILGNLSRLIDDSKVCFHSLNKSNLEYDVPEEEAIEELIVSMELAKRDVVAYLKAKLS